MIYLKSANYSSKYMYSLSKFFFKTTAMMMMKKIIVIYFIMLLFVEMWKDLESVL